MVTGASYYAYNVTDSGSLIYCFGFVAGEKEVKNNFQNLMSSRWRFSRKTVRYVPMHQNLGLLLGVALWVCLKYFTSLRFWICWHFPIVARVVPVWKLIILYLCKHEVLVWKPVWNGWICHGLVIGVCYCCVQNCTLSSFWLCFRDFELNSECVYWP